MIHALYIFSNNNYNCLIVRIKTKSYELFSNYNKIRNNVYLNV